MATELKPFLTISKQLELLEERGLIIDDPEYADYALTNINYYRLSGYSLPLRKNDQFYSGVKFSDIMQLYCFDSELKSILLAYLEEIEISMRTHIGYVLGFIHPKAHLDKSNYISTEHYDSFLRDMETAAKDNVNEAFMKHHSSKYNGVLPSWVAVETLSFGAVSRMYGGLQTDIQKEIANNYYQGVPPRHLTSWLHHLTVVRNLCAHRARIGNRGIPAAPLFLDGDIEKFVTLGYDSNSIGRRIFFSIVLIQRLSSDRTVPQSLVDDVSRLFEKYPFVSLKHYGFKQNWKEILQDVNKRYYK